jgi:hypothetical protein
MGHMQSVCKLAEFSGKNFWNFFSFLENPDLICFGDETRFSHIGFRERDFYLWIFARIIENSNNGRISAYGEYFLINSHHHVSSLEKKDIDREGIDIFPAEISVDSLLENVSTLFHRTILIGFNAVLFVNKDEPHKFFQHLKGLSLSNSLTVIVVGLHNSKSVSNWDIAFEYADVCVSHELVNKRPLLNPESDDSQVIDRIYKLTISKNRFDVQGTCAFIGEIQGKGFYCISKNRNYSFYSWRPVSASGKFLSNRYIVSDAGPSQVIDENDTIVGVGYFGFSLKRLLNLTKKKNPSSVLIDISRIDSSIAYEDFNEPIIILEVNPDFLNTGDAFSFSFSSNFNIITGQPKFLDAIKQEKKTVEAYLFTMEEYLPCLVEHRENFIAYWNDKLDTFIKLVESKELPEINI